ncbi:hypothetical protein G4B88_022446 [Cannabis sativa]|uniref:NB-ARC domain-containing protein n=1 Tax=Cannabis sativa TaxID=3483 RepID=A0A7J6HVU3_CANSA|nr:hypothetical protein G4B88_022446 [Cannabis sativa]
METSTQWCNDLGLISEGASTSDPPEVVGFESYEAELEGWLLDNEFKHKVIFIVGMGGLGKTTLAKLVYNKTQISDHFSCKAWVTVSQTFSNQKVIASMVRQFHQATTDSDPLGLGNDLNNHHDQHHQGELLQHLLEEERYMFVFDDVWNVSFCEHLKKVLPETKRGCTIIITTRVYKNLDVWWPQFFFVRVMEMQPLEPTMAFELFSKNVSQQITFFPPEMEKLSHEILQRCEGLPAALVAVGRFLSTKNKTFLGWKQFLEKNSSMLKLNLLLKDISESLLPKFGYLPLSIEACFLYFGVYPKDYLVSWKRLVRQLVAEGFVESEDMGNDHLNELVSLSLIQVPDANSTINGKPRWCRVQNLMHEAIQLVCDTKSGFVRSKQPEESNEDNFTDSHIRPRFPYMVGESIDPFNSTKWYANDRYKLLKLLDLEGCGNRVFVPEEVGNLIFLTYLSVRNTTIMMLPKSIGKLQRLQTLDLKYSLVCELPIEINNLRELKYILAYYYGKRRDTLLNTVRGVKINEGFGHWDGLRKLYHIEANNDVGLMKELRKFSQLKKLGITKLTKETSRALCTSFDTMYQLENLQLFSLSSDEILDLETLSFPSLLRSLHLEGCLDKLPGCIPRLQTLERLTLRFSKLTDDPLEDIQYLVSLIKLELYEAYDGEQLRFKNGGFQNLKVLSVRGLSRLNSISIDEWALPYLEEFTIGESTRLKEIPLGIKHLRTLKSLKLYDMGDEFGLSMVPNGGQHYYVVQHIQDVNFYYKRHGGKRYDVNTEEKPTGISKVVLKVIQWKILTKVLSETMAVMVRSSCFLTRPNNSSSSKPFPADQFSPKSHLPGKLALFSLKVEKLKSSLKDTHNEVLEIHHSQGNMQVNVPAVAFFVSNALVTVPFKALAETCEADNSMSNMPVLLAVALIGATVGGLLARQRKAELQRLNEQLRQINAALRRQAKIESYAPTLSYAPTAGRIPESEVIIDSRKQELISRLKAGKNFLRNQEPEKAFVEFKTALQLAQELNDAIEEKKAARGLGASLQRQGKYQEAIKYHSLVLEISERERENSGNTEAYGAIADCYTELGDLERAAKFYDQYISRLEKD